MKYILALLLLASMGFTLFIIYRLCTVPLIICYNAWKPPYGIDWTLTTAYNFMLLLVSWLPFALTHGALIHQICEKEKQKKALQKENNLINSIGE